MAAGGVGGAAAAQDLSMELYRAAVKSDDMTELIPEGLDGIVGQDRPASAVAIFFHEHSCGICHSALPEFHAVAKSFKAREDSSVAFAHMESSASKELIKKRAHLKGFPSLVVFRARAETPSDEDWPQELVGQTLGVSADQVLMLKAARAAHMGQEKDQQRLKALGKEGKVLAVDLLDHTAQLSLEGVGKAWFPLEALQKPDGSSLPFRRAEAAFLYLGAWRQRDMHDFIERMTTPLISTVSGTSWQAAASAVEKEKYPALFFCGGAEVTPGFVEAATALQGKSRAFHVPDQRACPAAAASSSSTSADAPASVVVYSPPGQQWSPSSRSTKGAAAVAGAEVIGDDEALVSWVSKNAFPGLVELDFINFADFVNSDRHGIMIAVRGPRGAGGEVSKMVEKRLREVGRPKQLDPRTDQFVYNDSSYFLGVIDGSLDGINTFGVSHQRLPRVVVFEGSGRWVEDEIELTVDRLAADLQKLPRLWRSYSGPWGTATWFAKSAVQSYNFYDDFCVQTIGEPGRFAMPTFMVCFAAWNLWQLAGLARAIAKALLESDADPASAAVEDKGSKKDK